MPTVTKAESHPSRGIQAEIKAYNIMKSRPMLAQYAPTAVNYGVNAIPSSNIARKLREQYPHDYNDSIPNVDFISTEHQGDTLFDWMWDESRETDKYRLECLAKHVLRGLVTLAHLRHEGCAHQDSACWNFCIEGIWIDFETAVFSHTIECKPVAMPEISVWPTFDMTVSGTDSATLLLSVVEKGPVWAGQSPFIQKCIKAVVPHLSPGDKERFHPAYLHAAERPLLSASGAAHAARSILEAEFGGTFIGGINTC